MNVNSQQNIFAALKENSAPLLAKIFYCAESDIDTVIVEEFIAGETLTEKTLTEAEARKIILQIYEGLKFLQAGKIIRLLDFDAARIFRYERLRAALTIRLRTN